jgi:hypothetical protein
MAKGGVEHQKPLMFFPYQTLFEENIGERIVPHCIWKRSKNAYKKAKLREIN